MLMPMSPPSAVTIRLSLLNLRLLLLVPSFPSFQGGSECFGPTGMDLPPLVSAEGVEVCPWPKRLEVRMHGSARDHYHYTSIAPNIAGTAAPSAAQASV